MFTADALQQVTLQNWYLNTIASIVNEFTIPVLGYSMAILGKGILRNALNNESFCYLWGKLSVIHGQKSQKMSNLIRPYHIC